MTPSAVARAAQGLNGMARKVLDAVPIEEAWAKSRVMGELRRTGSCASADVVEACLNVLRGRGLVTEPTRGVFRRVTARTGATHQDDYEELLDMAPVAPASPSLSLVAAAPTDPLARFALLAKDLAGLADALHAKAREVEEAALEVGEYIQKLGVDSDRLRQFQALLKGMAA